MKILWIILALLTVGLLVILAGAWSVFGEKLKAAQSVKKLEEGLYYLEYSGDYGFDAFLEKGGSFFRSRHGRVYYIFPLRRFCERRSQACSTGFRLQHADCSFSYGQKF